MLDAILAHIEFVERNNIFGEVVADAVICAELKEAERPVIISAPGYRYEAATEGKHQMACVVMKTRDTLPHNSSTHIADEIGYIIKGALEMTIDGEKYIVNEGDCVYIDANTLHDYRRISDEECVSIWIYASAAATPGRLLS